MENVLDTYSQPYDEQPVQLLKETRAPIAATKRHARRVDYEYERAGTASIFMSAEPLCGWRQATARPRRTKVDWAFEMNRLLETRYAKAEKVILVCDNLNTHTMGAFYEAFPAEKARELVRRLDFRFTPKHGSWLNIPENELSSMTRQCLNGRRVGDIKELRKEIGASPCAKIALELLGYENVKSLPWGMASWNTTLAGSWTNNCFDNLAVVNTVNENDGLSANAYPEMTGTVEERVTGMLAGFPGHIEGAFQFTPYASFDMDELAGQCPDGYAGCGVLLDGPAQQPDHGLSEHDGIRGLQPEIRQQWFVPYCTERSQVDRSTTVEQATRC